MARTHWKRCAVIVISLPLVAHRDLTSTIHVRNAAESGQTRTDVNDSERSSDRRRKTVITPILNLGGR
jgi:hypothetical protein